MFSVSLRQLIVLFLQLTGSDYYFKGALPHKTVFTCIFGNMLGPYVFVLCRECENELLPPLSALATKKK